MITEKKDKIFLIGFMGSGKSTLGKKIARALHYEFSDLDNYIESVAAQSISSIFETQGEDYFRKLETACLQNYSSQKNLVIATGGGTPCFNNNMELMLQEGCCVYIKMPEGALYQRLYQATPKRPLLAGKSEEELKEFIRLKMLEREPVYLKSHIVIDGMSLSTASLTGILRGKVLLP